MLIVYSMYGVFASAKDYDFEKPDLGFYGVKLAYHVNMNNYFNDKVGLFLKTKTDDPNYGVPADVDKCVGDDTAACVAEKCGEKNVSTYCVAMGALDMYYAYADTLDEISPMLLQIQSETGAPVVGNVVGTVANLFTSLSVNDSKVAEEKANAMKAVDMTVSAYNELRLAYPVHLKYAEITKELYTYVDSLRKLRNNLYLFPAKFIDSSSQSCK